MALTLYYHPLASYCHKVLIALYERGVDFERRVVNLADAAQRAELCALWPVGKFPVIRDHARGLDLAESTIVIEYLDLHAGGGAPLVPQDRDAALEVRLWDRICDQHVQGPMQEIVGDRLRGAGGDMTAARAMLRTAYGMMERQLASRQWLAGAGFSMADCAAAPALFFASTLEPITAQQHALQAYFERLVERPSVRRVIAEAAPWFRHYPFADAIPERFRQGAAPD
jgi:glutathione S-transferase